MPLPVRDVVGILADNLRLRGSVLPMPARRATRWARDLDLPRGGETVLYTGMMYQLIPYIERLVALEQQLGDSRLVRFSGLARRANRLVNGASLVARPRARRARGVRPRARERRAAPAQRRRRVRLPVRGRPLRGRARARPRRRQRRRRPCAARRRGLPQARCARGDHDRPAHDARCCGSVYPRLVDGYDVEVQQLPRGARRARAPVHGPRLRARSSCTTPASMRATRTSSRRRASCSRPRVSGSREPANAGKLTWCCGGPAEALDPALAATVAAARVEQLRAPATECVTMCPICLVNLRKAANGAIRIRDISEYLAEASHAPQVADGPCTERSP